MHCGYGTRNLCRQNLVPYAPGILDPKIMKTKKPCNVRYTLGTKNTMQSIHHCLEHLDLPDFPGSKAPSPGGYVVELSCDFRFRTWVGLAALPALLFALP